MLLDEPHHSVRHRPYIAAVAVFIVHDQPLWMAEFIDLSSLSHQPRIRIADEAW